MTGAELYAEYLRGDNAALEALVARYGDSLVGYAYCILRDFSAAEDAMEDSFAALIVKRKKFRESGVPFEAYLFRIVRNKCMDYLRRAGRETVLDDAAYVNSNRDVEKDALKSVRDEKVYRALFRLPEAYREALYLMYYRDFSADEISAALKKSKKQVYNLLARGKAALKQILVKEGIGHEDL